jgi:hypothetical protein
MVIAQMATADVECPVQEPERFGEVPLLKRPRAFVVKARRFDELGLGVARQLRRSRPQSIPLAPD